MENVLSFWRRKKFAVMDLRTKTFIYICQSGNARLLSNKERLQRTKRRKNKERKKLKIQRKMECTYEWIVVLFFQQWIHLLGCIKLCKKKHLLAYSHTEFCHKYATQIQYIYYQRIFIIILLAWLHSCTPKTIRCAVLCSLIHRFCFHLVFARLAHNSLIIWCWNAVTKDKINEHFYSIFLSFPSLPPSLFEAILKIDVHFDIGKVSVKVMHTSYINWLVSISICSVISFHIFFFFVSFVFCHFV